MIAPVSRKSETFDRPRGRVASTSTDASSSVALGDDNRLGARRWPSWTFVAWSTGAWEDGPFG